VQRVIDASNDHSAETLVLVGVTESRIDLDKQTGVSAKPMQGDTDFLVAAGSPLITDSQGVETSPGAVVNEHPTSIKEEPPNSSNQPGDVGCALVGLFSGLCLGFVFKSVIETITGPFLRGGFGNGLSAALICSFLGGATGLIMGNYLGAHSNKRKHKSS
jgi:hypothetical protein